MGNDKGRIILRVIVALYLFYLSYQIVQSGIVSGEAKGGQLALLYVAVVGFIAAACFFLYQSYKMVKAMREESEQARNELSAERAEEAKRKMLEGETVEVIPEESEEVIDAVDAEVVDVADAEVVDETDKDVNKS